MLSRRRHDLGDSGTGTGDHLEVRRPARSVLPYRPAAHRRSYPYVLTQVASLDAFGEPLTIDYPAYTAGQVMLESADRLVAEETEPALQQYLLLMGALRALTPTLAVAFELRTANLIAMLDPSNDRAEVRERLGLQKGDEP